LTNIKFFLIERCDKEIDSLFGNGNGNENYWQVLISLRIAKPEVCRRVMIVALLPLASQFT